MPERGMTVTDELVRHNEHLPSTRYAVPRHDLMSYNYDYRTGTWRVTPPGGLDYRSRINRARQLANALDIAEDTIAGVDERSAPLVRELFETLDDIVRALPKVECWVIVKVYPESSIMTTKETVWAGCLTRKQAEKFAPAIKAHYVKAHRRDFGDAFVVRRGLCEIRQILREDMTPAEYTRSLG